MKVLALIPKAGKESAKYVVEATEEELDKVSGIAGVEHIAGRIQVGHEINVTVVYDKLEYFVREKAKLAAAETTLRNTADSIKNLLPKE